MLLKAFKANGYLAINIAELACYLFKHDVLGAGLIKTVIDLLADLSHFEDFSNFSALRIIFSKPFLKEYRNEALEKLVKPHHYGFYSLSQLPTFAPNISFFADFYDDPVFDKWLKALPECHAQSIINVVQYDKANTVSPSLNVEDGP